MLTQMLHIVHKFVILVLFGSFLGLGDCLVGVMTCAICLPFGHDSKIATHRLKKLSKSEKLPSKKWPFCDTGFWHVWCHFSHICLPRYHSWPNHEFHCVVKNMPKTRPEKSRFLTKWKNDKMSTDFYFSARCIFKTRKNTWFLGQFLVKIV